MMNGILLPRMEKNIINPADIWTTLRLPTRVNANKPAFSLRGEIRIWLYHVGKEKQRD